MLHRRESLQCDARISRAEWSVDRADSLVPTLDLLTAFPNGSNVVGQALPRQHTQFDLGNSEPTRVFGRVMDLQAVDQTELWLVPAERLQSKKRECGS